MSRFIIISFLILLTFIISPNKTLAETPLDVYMNDFYSKSNEASKILKEIETNLKEGSRTVSYTHLTLPTIYSV